MRGQSGLRPRARQNGRLLHRILHRLGEVVFGHLQAVLRRKNPGHHSLHDSVKNVLEFISPDTIPYGQVNRLKHKLGRLILRQRLSDRNHLWLR